MDKRKALYPALLVAAAAVTVLSAAGAVSILRLPGETDRGRTAMVQSTSEHRGGGNHAQPDSAGRGSKPQQQGSRAHLSCANEDRADQGE